ncbi:MAG: hypothetical protein HYS05_10140 [Acidobacteria bacterium]|nr:hypothetical protein [Acidobacteriota bacterium]
MARRASAIGGHLEVTSAPGSEGHGTSLTLTMPLARRRPIWRPHAAP